MAALLSWDAAFDATVYDTAPLPTPPVGGTSATHEAVALAVHSHCGDDAATWRVAVPPSAAKLRPEGSMAIVQSGVAGGSV